MTRPINGPIMDPMTVRIPGASARPMTRMIIRDRQADPVLAQVPEVGRLDIDI